MFKDTSHRIFIREFILTSLKHYIFRFKLDFKAPGIGTNLSGSSFIHDNEDISINI